MKTCTVGFILANGDCSGGISCQEFYTGYILKKHYNAIKASSSDCNTLLQRQMLNEFCLIKTLTEDLFINLEANCKWIVNTASPNWMTITLLLN